MKRTADPRAKPFEFRAGVGMPGFRGMRTEGDPSFMPPHQFRYLQNVRIGHGDVRSRPGLKLDDTLDAPAVWLTEIAEDVQAATVYAGPASTFDERSYQAVTTDKMTHAYSRHDFSRLEYPGDTTSGQRASALFGLFEKYSTLGLVDGVLNALAPCAAEPFVWSEGDGPIGRGSAHNTGWEPNDWQSGIHGLGFFQHAACMDPIIRWVDREGNARWLAAGAYRGNRWTGVGNYDPPYYSAATGGGYVAAAGDPTKGGQSLVEVNFDTKKALDRQVIAGYDETNGFEDTVLFPGGVTEIARMPAPGYKTGCKVYGPGPVPTASFDPTMYPNMEFIRSMVSVGRRADDPISNEERTQETVYIGTAGGKVLAIDGASAAEKWGINDADDGAVWSFDGTTLQKVVSSGIGAMVCVAKTPDGGVLAAGRKGAKFLAEKGGTWQTVTYSPSYTTGGGLTAWDPYNIGFFWCSRAVFQGKLYLYGYDIGAGYVSNNASTANPARLVIYRFDQSSLTLTRVRRGSDFDQASGNNLMMGGGKYVRLNSQSIQAVLATDGAYLYYMSGFSSPSKAYVGRFDGTTWDDDVYGIVYLSSSWPSDMVFAGGGLYLMQFPGRWWTILNGILVGPYTISSGSDRPFYRAFVGP